MAQLWKSILRIPALLPVLSLLLLAAPGAAQTRPKMAARGEKNVETQVFVELLTGTEGVGIRAQEWARIFENLQVSFKVRRAVLEEQPEITEKLIGTSLREVSAVGRLERNGAITFPNRSFQQSDTAKLKEWLTELRTYGAQGSPAGQPLWGLTKAQFDPLFQALSKPLTEEPRELALPDSLRLFAVTDVYRLQLTPGAETYLKRQKLPPAVRQSYKGFTQGTALALVLNEFGLGFRPRRTPDGTIELAIFPLSETTDVWPLGWPLKEKGPVAVPQFYKLVKVEFQDESLSDILDAVPGFLKLPLLIDDYGLRVQQIDLSKVKVTYPSKQTTWSLALKGLTFQGRVRREIWMDEAGKPFLWITPLSTKRKAQE